jgi:hypothetical protein
MEYLARQDGRIQETRYLEISPSVLHIHGVRFTAAVSNKTGTPRLTVDEACQTLDLEVLYERTDWRDPEIQARLRVADKYELLVPDAVPLHLITGM